MERTKIGVKGMDELLGGGLPRGRTVLLSGSCGTGKTTFASHFVCQGVKKKEPCVYITFEQSKKKLIEDMKEVGIDFEKMESSGLFRLVGGPVGLIRRFKDMAKANVFDLAYEMKEIVDEVKAKRVVLDSVNLFTMLFETDSERRKALAALTSTLDKLGCTTLMTCEVREGTKDISWYGFEEFVVDGVMVLFRIPFESMYERGATVIKMRGIEHSKKLCAMQIKKNGIVVYPDKEPFHKIDDKS